MSTSDASEFIIPDGQYPPYAIITDTDHEAWIIIATTLGLAIALLFGGIRAFVRSTICPGVGLDDAFLAAATVGLPDLGAPSPLICSARYIMSLFAN